MNLQLFFIFIGLVLQCLHVLSESSSVSSSDSKETVVNIAPGKNTSQSSEYVLPIYPAHFAIDGNISTFQHTKNQTNPYWQIDLEKKYYIRRIEILNRIDCCGERLRNVEIHVGPTTDNLKLCATHKGPAIDGAYLLFNCTEITTGRYVKIMLNATTFLHMAEVEVFVPVADKTTAMPTTTPTEQPSKTAQQTTTVTAKQSTISVQHTISATAEQSTYTVQQTTFDVDQADETTAMTTIVPAKQSTNTLQQTTLDVEQSESDEQTPEVCYCPCSKVNNKWSHLAGLNLTYSELKEAMKDDLAKLEKELSVDKKKTSSSIRRRTSAPDGRKSSANMGVFAVIITCLPICFCVCIDCTRCCCRGSKKRKRS